MPIQKFTILRANEYDRLMDELDTTRIDAFPSDNQIWQVTWFTDVIHQLSTPTEPKVGLSIAPFKYRPLTSHAFSDTNSLDQQQRHVIYVNAGYLPFINIGSCFLNRTRITNPTWQYETINLAFSFIRGETARIIPANSGLVANSNKYLIPPYVHYLGHEGLKTKLLSINDIGISNQIVIPTLEVVRFFYINSSNLARLILWSGLEGSNKIFNPERTRKISDNTGILDLRKELYNEDCWVISQFAFDNEAFDRAKLIYGSMQTRRINDEFVVPDAYFPFDRSYNVKAQGRYIKHGNTWRFLVLRLLSCNQSFPIQKLYLDRDLNNRNTSDDPDRTHIDMPSKKKPANRNNKTTDLTTKSEPDKQIEPMHVLLDDTRFDWLSGKHYDLVPPKEATHKSSGKNTPVTIDTPPEGASGEGVYNKSKIIPFAAVPEQTKDTDKENTIQKQKGLPADFTRMKRVLDKLSELNVSYESLVLDGNRDESGKYNIYPVFTKTGQPGRWSHLKDGSPRRTLIVELILQDKYIFYLFESEPGQQQATTLLLHNKALSHIENPKIEHVLKCASYNNGVWEKRPIFPTKHYIRLKHTWTNTTKFAERLLKEIKNAIPPSHDDNSNSEISHPCNIL